MLLAAPGRRHQHACTSPNDAIRPDAGKRTTMTNSPEAAVADPTSTDPAEASAAPAASGRANGRDTGGVIARGEREASEAIAAALTDLGFSSRQVDLRPLPFEGTWGLAT